MKTHTLLFAGALCLAPSLEALPAAPVDLNNDLHTDLLWYNSTTGQDSVWYMNNTALDHAVNLPKFTLVLSAAGDFNGDSKTDLVYFDRQHSRLSIWVMDGVNVLSAVYSYCVDYPKGTGDFDGDGNTDILLTQPRWVMGNDNARDDLVLIRYCDGSTVQSRDKMIEYNVDANGTSFVIPIDIRYGQAKGVLLRQNFKLCASGDFNGDDKPDLIVWNSVTGQRVILLMDNYVIQSEVVLPGTNPLWRPCAAGDYNGDTHTDILFFNTATSTRSIWLMNETNFVSAVSVPGNNPLWLPAGIAPN